MYASPCSVSTLYLLGLLSVNDISENGDISDSVRRAAEEEYARLYLTQNDDSQTQMRRVGVQRIQRSPQSRRMEFIDLLRRNRTTSSAREYVEEEVTACDAENEGIVALEAEVACCVCMSRRKTHVCLPCFHLCMCGTCARQVGQSCPICRADMVPRLIYW